MPTGSLSPATYPTDAITVRCDRCGRVGRYRRLALAERYGCDAALPDVLNAITACERNERLSTDRCKAYFEELRVRSGAVSLDDAYKTARQRKQGVFSATRILRPS